MFFEQLMARYRLRRAFLLYAICFLPELELQLCIVALPLDEPSSRLRLIPVRLLCCDLLQLLSLPL